MDGSQGRGALLGLKAQARGSSTAERQARTPPAQVLGNFERTARENCFRITEARICSDACNSVQGDEKGVTRLG